jgi:metal-responsive CopG/Arc/MetJ family transcriptional regulator
MPKRLATTISDNLYEELEKYCGEDISKSAIMTIALREYLSKEKNKKNEKNKEEEAE